MKDVVDMTKHLTEAMLAVRAPLPAQAQASPAEEPKQAAPPSMVESVVAAIEGRLAAAATAP
eukprot:15483626-Alexandrium_andersonii.AAC.1